MSIGTREEVGQKNIGKNISRKYKDKKAQFLNC